MKKQFIIGFVVFLIALILIVLLVNQYLKKDSSEYNENYYNILSRIEKGNNWIKENGWGDLCDAWRYYHRGCYYQQYPGLDGTDAIVGGNLQHYNLTHGEIWNLCKKFVFVGHVVYCLNQNAETNAEEQECLDFAKDDEYLIRICNLEEGKLIPSENWGPYQGDTTSKVDSWETIEPKGYPYN